MKTGLLFLVIVLAYLTFTGCNGGNTGAPEPPIAANREYFLPYLAGADGLYLVYAGRFDDVSHIISGEVTQVRQVVAVPPIGSVPRIATPHALVFVNDSQWRRVWLGKNRSQTPALLGPRLTHAICTSQLIYGDLGNPDTSLLRYSDAGLNDSCFDSDDQFFTFAIGTAADPAFFDFEGVLIDQIHGASGALKGLVLIRGTSLVLLEYPSGATTTLLDTLSVPAYALQRVPDGLWLQIGNDWRRVSVPAGLSPVRYTIANGYGRFTAHATDADYFYFLDTGLASGDGTPSRLWRLRMDGSADAEIIYESPSEAIDYVTNTAGRVWLSKSNQDPQKLLWLDKNNIANAPQLAEQIGSGAIGYVRAGDRLAINVQDTTNLPYRVKLVRDDGSVLLNVANAQFELYKVDFPSFFSLGRENQSAHIVLVERGDNLDGTNGNQGAGLFTYDTQTLEKTHMYTFDRNRILLGFGFGHAGLGIYYDTDSMLNTTGPDLFAYDVENGRFKIFPATPGINEAPIN